MASEDTLLIFEVPVYVFIKLDDLSAFLLYVISHLVHEHVPPYLTLILNFPSGLLSLHFCLRLKLGLVLQRGGENFFRVLYDFAGAP
jgi:hypothetical protein